MIAKQSRPVLDTKSLARATVERLRDEGCDERRIISIMSEVLDLLTTELCAARPAPRAVD